MSWIPPSFSADESMHAPQLNANPLNENIIQKYLWVASRITSLFVSTNFEVKHLSIVISKGIIEVKSKSLKWIFLIEISQIHPIVIAQMLCFKMGWKKLAFGKCLIELTRLSALIRLPLSSVLSASSVFKRSYQLQCNTKKKTNAANNISLKTLLWHSKHKSITKQYNFQVKCVLFSDIFRSEC